MICESILIRSTNLVTLNVSNDLRVGQRKFAKAGMDAAINQRGELKSQIVSAWKGKEEL